MIAWECIGRTVVAPAGVTVILIARNKVTWFNVNDTDPAWRALTLQNDGVIAV